MIAIWDNRLSVGEAAIDAEHRLVLNLLNELDVAFSVKAPAKVVEKAMESLVRAVERHFARDAATYGPVGRHEAYLAKVRRLLDAWRSGDHRAVDRRTLMDLARRWIDHIGRREPLGQALKTAQAAMTG
jgi:hemerythrin